MANFNFNKVTLGGRLTGYPELKQTPNGVSVCTFSIAVNRRGANGETDFFNCTAWRGQAETIARYTKKGNKVAVSGSVQLRNYEDNQGVKRTAVDIIVQDVEFLTPKSGDGFDEGFDAPRASAAPAKKTKPVLQAMEGDDDIPF